MTSPFFMKTCYVCGKLLPAAEFYNNSARPDGLSAACKRCSDRINREYKATPDGAESVRLTQTRNRRKHGILPRVRQEFSETHARCTKCGEWKTRDQFESHVHTRSGVHTRCKACRKLKT